MENKFKPGNFVSIRFADGSSVSGTIFRNVQNINRWVVKTTDDILLQVPESSLTLTEMTRDDVMRSTASHIRRVGTLLTDCISDLGFRAVTHDASKWSAEEWPSFAAATPKLATSTYGSEEYKANLREIKDAVTHHQQNNSHHPEFHLSGVDGMTLLDLVEMLCDWKAAGERHVDGDILKSIEKNVERFKLSPQLVSILRNTCESLGWVSSASPS